VAVLTGTVAFILKGYPRLSETFIAQEILALERRGLDIRIVSLRHPTDRQVQPVHREIGAAVSYLPEYLHQEPLRVLRAWRQARRLPGYRETWRTWWRDLRRDFTRNRIRRFGQALVLAAELPAGVTRLHAHFLHTPATVTHYAALMTGLPWSISAHAKDIWTIPDWEKREKLQSCAWLTTCTATGAEHLRALAPEADVSLIYHGLDLDRFPAPEPHADDPIDAPVEIVSVGRAVEKKGYDVLLDALARLPTALNWRLVHVGGGPLLDTFKALAREHGLENRITWHGPQPQEQVLRHLRHAQVFVLATRIAADGDRDGLPNVLMEAQSQRLACVASDIAGVPELIEHGVTGLLVPPEDPAALAGALETLIRDPERRRALAEAGLDRLRNNFAMDTWIDRLAAKFGLGLNENGGG
jgi:glycosyltransferase involved in cell wall biosynthesis